MFASRLTAAALVLTFLILPPADAASTDAKAAKAAVKCQNAIAQASAKLVGVELKSLDACSTAILTCIQTKPGDAACTTKAEGKCSKALLDAIPQAESKLAAKIVKSCGAPLRPADLLAADGLGIGARAGACDVDFGINVCTSLPAIAQCVVAENGRAARRLFAAEQPRAAELIATVLNPVPLADLPVFPGCADCAQAPSDPTGKAIAQCGAAMTKSGRSFAAAVQKGLTTCVGKVFACVQTKPGDAKCLGKATDACDGVLAKLTAAGAKLSSGIDKKCADQTLLPFATLAAAAALNLDGLGPDCAALGGGVATLDDYVACVRRQHECGVAAAIRSSFPRVGELLDGGALGDAGPLLDPGTCPGALPSDASSLVRSAPAPKRFSFFTMSRFFSMTKKPTNGPPVKATTVAGFAPSSSLNASRRVIVSSAPNRFVPGTSQIIKVKYTAFSPHPVTLGPGAPSVAPPTMVVAARRDDFAVTDHLELPLDPLPPGTEGEVELQVDYDADPPSCVFDLAFAVSEGGEVSDYTAVEQTSDTVPPPTETPTATATAAVTPSPTTTAVPPSPTPVPPTATPTPGGTPGGPDLAYALRTDDDPVAPGGTATLTLTVTNLTNAPQSAAMTFTVPPFTSFAGFGPGSVRGVAFNGILPGASQSAIISLAIANGASAPPDGTTIDVTFHDTARGKSVSRSFSTDASPSATLALSTADATVAPGGTFRYALAFANVGIDPLANAELSVAVPLGASFVAADTGGELGLDGIVRWPLGTLAGNTSGQRTVTFAAGANAQAPLVVNAELDANAAPLAHASAATAVYANPIFSYALTTVDDAVEPGGTALYRVTVTNRSNAAQDATLAFRVPDFTSFGGFVAGAVRSVAFTDVPAGGSETALVALVVATGAGAPPDGTVIPFAVQDTARGIVVSRAIVARSAPSAELTLATAFGTVKTGHAFTYTLAYSNPGLAPLDGIELSVRVPDGTSFVDANENGSLDADGIVRWQLGTLAGNSSGQRTVTFTASAGPRPLVVEAALRAENGELLTQASAATTVRSTPAFAYTVTTEDDAVRPGGTAVFRVTVTNLTNAAQDATLSFRVPDFTSFAGFVAGAVRAVAFTGVPAGGSQSALLPFVVATGAAAPPDGTVMQFGVDDTARGVAVSRTIVADATPTAELTLSTSAGTVAPGGTFAYTLGYTNPSIAPLPTTELAVRVPAGASVVFADEDVAPDADGILRWPIGTVPGNGSGERTVVFAAGGGAVAPFLVEADVHDGSTHAIRTQASAATTVSANPAFAYRVTTTDDDPIKPGRTATFLVTATNLTNAAQSATVSFRVPDFTSYAGFTAGALRGLAFTDVPPGGSQAVLVALTVTSGAAAPPDGTVIAFGIDDTDRGAAVSRTIVAESAGRAELKLSTDQSTVPPTGPITYTLSFHNAQASTLDGATLAVRVPAGASFVSAEGGVTPDANGVVSWPLGTLAAGATGTRDVTFAAEQTTTAPLLVEAELIDASGDPLAHASATTPIYVIPTFVYGLTTASDTVTAGQTVEFDLVVVNTTNTPQTATLSFRVPDFTTFGGFVAGAIRSVTFTNVPPSSPSAPVAINLTVTTGAQAPPSGTLIDLTTTDGARGASVSKTIVVN